MDREKQIEILVDEFMERRKHVVAHALAHLFKDRLKENKSEWIAISSLSQLRSEVGGRFQNIKDKWIASGFPLKEHRGDIVAEFSCDLKNWLLLQKWIESRGYSARLGSKSDSCFFYVKATLAAKSS